MQRIMSKLVVFGIVFFVCMTIIFLGRIVVWLFSSIELRYFSIPSMVMSFLGAVWYMWQVKKAGGANLLIIADRFIRECAQIVSGMEEVADETGSKKYTHLLYASALSALIGGSYLLPGSGMNRTILRAIAIRFGRNFGNGFSEYFHDCHDCIQGQINGPSDPSVPVVFAAHWLCSEIEKHKGCELEHERSEAIQDIFERRLITAVYESPKWIKNPQG